VTPGQSNGAPRVLVTGSRDWGWPEVIQDQFGLLYAEHDTNVTIVHGAASRKVGGIQKSADMLADSLARLFGFQVERHPADWDKHGKAAGFIRNVEMLDTGIDRVLAFQRNGSRGTQHTINEARKRGIPVGGLLCLSSDVQKAPQRSARSRTRRTGSR